MYADGRPRLSLIDTDRARARPPRRRAGGAAGAGRGPKLGKVQANGVVVGENSRSQGCDDVTQYAVALPVVRTVKTSCGCGRVA